MSDGHRSSMALVIVLFVLLIIVGTSFIMGGGY
ncbi:YjcZ family sporulation protein [Bacillus sp. UNC41MFS5]|nr:YjcZ family sporulation protein [Bacillus sp. UNC41MFS5]